VATVALALVVLGLHSSSCQIAGLEASAIHSQLQLSLLLDLHISVSSSLKHALTIQGQ